MKGMRCLIITLIGLLVMANVALAGTLRYQPEVIRVVVPAGSQEQVQLKVNVDSPRGSSYMLWFVDSVKSGNLPMSWITASPARAFVFRTSPGASTLTVAVPNGAKAGTYTGQLVARAMSTHEIPGAGTGVLLEVTVPPNCSGVPVVTIDEIGPTILWPPDHSMTQVIASGTIVAPEGCSIEEAGYAVEDEYGVLSAVGTLSISGKGAFTLALPVEAMRYGKDKDGRHYQVTVFARDEAGYSSTEPQEILVPHDQRKTD